MMTARREPKRFMARATWLTTKAAAAYTGLQPRQIKHLAETGQLAYKLKGARNLKLFHVDDLAKILRDPEP